MTAATLMETAIDRRGRWNTASCLYPQAGSFAFGKERSEAIYSDLERTRTVSSLRILPGAPLSMFRRLESLRKQGLIVWGGQPLRPIEPIARTQGEGTVAEIIVSERR